MHYTVASNGRVFLALKWSVWATKKDISLHNIQRNIWKSKMADVDMFGS